jgi:sugar (pentulose or hexulose) kinase
MEEVILIFDVGKTNKKVLLFNRTLQVVRKEESRFEEVPDDEGFPCDDVNKIEQWVKDTMVQYLAMNEYLVRGINFTTYGASLVYLDDTAKRLTPLYNYLKPIPDQVLEGFYESRGGVEEFSRRTASPPLGMLNSGLQLFWLKRTRPGQFSKVKHILHFPQYLAFLVHGKIVSELTSIGCHTGMWDFDNMQYHPWLKEEGIILPDPEPVSNTFRVELEGNQLHTGIGIHDSSASLAPYIINSKEPFILVSTGTWCISMNPFNHEPLTVKELNQDCLCFLGVHGLAVKSSRFFLGRIHDLNVERLQEYFGREETAYKNVNPGTIVIRELWESGERGAQFFRNGIPQGWVDLQVDPVEFETFEEAYTCLMVDLTRLVVEAIGLIIAKKDLTKHLYITGGFARNPIFNTTLALAFPDKNLFTSDMDNASSLGAALVMAENVWEGVTGQLDLGLTSSVPPRPLR